MQRDFVGHGPDTPLDVWPDGSLVAVNIVINVEEGAEAAWPDGEGNDAWGEFAIPVDPAIRDAGARLMTIGLHPRWSGQAARGAAVRDVLAHLSARPGISLVHRERIVEWWTETTG